MKLSSMVFSLIFCLPVFGAPEPSAEATVWNETLSTEQGEFSVSVNPAKKKIEVKKVEDSNSAPPHLRVRVLRENDRPLELRLKTVERTNSPLFYTGQLKQWKDSYIGLEFDFSFDKKTWKRLGKTLKKVVP